MTDQNPLNQQDKERLQFLLDCYGAYEHHWPEEHRVWILRLIATSPEAEHLRQQAAELDLLLDVAPAEPQTDHLVSEILANAHRAKPANLWNWWPYESIWRPLSALTMAGAFGLMLGVNAPDWIYNQDNIEIQEDYIAFSESGFGSGFLEGEIN